ENIVADELQISMATAEQPRKLLLHAGIDALESLFKARARLLVDTAHRLIQRLERRGQILELPIEILLALAPLLELVAGGQIDLTQLVHVRADLGKRVLPVENVGFGCEIAWHLGQIEMRLRELFGHGLATHSRFL